jgi:hypothetical protein
MAYRGSVLVSGSFLSSDRQNAEGDDTMTSPDWVPYPFQGFYATLEPNGNFVIFPAGSGMPLWQSGSPAPPPLPPRFSRAVLQPDGDLCIEQCSDPAQGWSPLWSASTLSNWSPAQGEKTFAMLRNDGSLTVFAGADQTTNRNGIWTTATCLRLDGGGCLIAPRSYGFGLGDFTIECWLQIRSSGTIISTKVPGGGYSGFIFSVTNDGAFHFALDNGFAFYAIDSTAPTHALDGNFHHLAVVRRSCALTMYYDTYRCRLRSGTMERPTR